MTSAGTLAALAVVRVPRGAARPTNQELRHALEQDRHALHLAPAAVEGDLVVTGPYPVTMGEQQFDEYVVWER